MQPFFGDLHVHTRYSLMTPAPRAHVPRRSRPIALPGARSSVSSPGPRAVKGVRSLQLRRPLDFAMVSDHAELIGEVHMCNSPEVAGYSSWQCLLYRHWPRGAYYLFNYMATMQATHMGMCGEDGALCLQAAMDALAGHARGRRETLRPQRQL